MGRMTMEALLTQLLLNLSKCQGSKKRNGMAYFRRRQATAMSTVLQGTKQGYFRLWKFIETFSFYFPLKLLGGMC